MITETAQPTQIWPAHGAAELCGISVVDLFGMDKVGMSPREVTNRFVAESAISIPGAVKLAESVEDTIWEDLFIDGNTAEYCKRAW